MYEYIYFHSIHSFIHTCTNLSFDMKPTSSINADQTPSLEWISWCEFSSFCVCTEKNVRKTYVQQCVSHVVIIFIMLHISPLVLSLNFNFNNKFTSEYKLPYSLLLDVLLPHLLCIVWHCCWAFMTLLPICCV